MASELTDYQKRYILEHYQTLSKNKLAKTLGVPKKDIIRFIKKYKEEGDSGDKVFPQHKKRIDRFPPLLWTLIFFCVAVFAFSLRLGTFFQSHNTGDQVFYTAVAMKLDKFGFNGYNLQEVGLRKINDHTTLIIHEKNPERTLLAVHKKDGFNFYDEPVFYAPPVLPYLIKFSHDIFAGGKDYLMAKKPQFNDKGLPRFLKFEFYRTIVPFSFSILTIILLIIFCKTYFNRHIALYAALLLSVSPIDIMSSSRVWADTALTFFIALSLALFYIADEKKNIFYAILGGISWGLAILTKTSAIALISIVGLYHLWVNKERLKGFNGVISVLFDRKLWAYAITAFLITLPWFWVITKTFGNPLHFPSQENVLEVMNWFKMVRSRPWYTYPADIAYQNPLLALSAVSLSLSFKNRKAKFLLVTWSLVFFLALTLLTKGKENRYMLPAYPALAVLAGCVLYRIKEAFNLRIAKRSGDIAVLALIAVSAFWSVRLAFMYVFFTPMDWLPIPF